jgi:3-oxoacyl-[acyl-carrier-protein] synthase-3
MDTVAAIAMIQPLAWYQGAVADGLGIPKERVPTTYSAYAHLGGAGVIANLLEAKRRGLLFDGAPVILYAHGAGVTQYAALLRWSDRS